MVAGARVAIESGAAMAFTRLLFFHFYLHSLSLKLSFIIYDYIKTVLYYYVTMTFLP